ncbi:MAG: cysteine--tRNA ligase [Bacilli bacterium]
MKLYNTLTKKVEPFVPNQDIEVKMYTCGPTVYNYAHIGNLRTYIFEDVLEKSLNYLGYKVKRVMNITDVGHMESDDGSGEDKMIKGAKREGKSVFEIADFYTKAFLEDLTKLNIKKPDIIRKATDHIADYIEIIKVLLEKEYAYIANGNVYFDVTKMPDYYQLSGMNESDLIVGAREEVEEDKDKRHPFDFGLWFTKSKYANQILQWDSPWGKGYPGWHIECSAIAIKMLGDKLDIHCGGVDNIFPHHTNEIAQAEAYLGHKWCNYWLHGEHLNDLTGKMSKSKGEFLTLNLLQEKGYNPLVYRFFVLQSHYRRQLIFTYDSLNIATIAYNKLKSRISNLEINEDEELQTALINKYKEQFINCIEDDLNTANALTVLFNLLKDEELNNRSKLWLIDDFDKIFSLDLTKNKEEVDSDLIKYVEQKIAERKIARQKGDYELADKIRDELEEKKIILMDTNNTTKWRMEE